MSRRRRGRVIDGILLLDKPAGISSNSAMQRVRILFEARKAGHTGNLDVPATGLLPICLGEATKITPYLLDATKSYKARIRLGERTDTGDAAGRLIERLPVPALTAKKVEAVMEGFVGKISQVPPMYSALKHQGQRLYRLAARGETVERKPREVTIQRLQLLVCEGDILEIEVVCSKGTYIRTLAEDLAVALRTCGRLETLRRLQVGPFRLGDAYTLDALTSYREAGSEALDRLLIPMDRAIVHLPAVSLGEDSVFYLRRGQAVRVAGAGTGPVRLYDAGQSFLGVGEMLGDGRVAPRRLLCHQEAEE